MYVGFIAVAANLLVTAIVTFIMRAAKAPDGVDATVPEDYEAEGPSEAPPGLAGEGTREPVPTG